MTAEIFPNSEHMEQLGERMTNFDHSIVPGTAELLSENPEKVRCQYPGWNFFATVWAAKEGGYVAEVRVHHVVNGYIKAPTLSELMELVSNQYGND